LLTKQAQISSFAQLGKNEVSVWVFIHCVMGSKSPQW